MSANPFFVEDLAGLARTPSQIEIACRSLPAKERPLEELL